MTKQAKAVERFSVAHQFSHLKFGFALLGLVLVAGLETGRAQTSYYWDTNGATAGVGGTGNWTTNGTTWTTNAAGNVATISGAWANGNTNYAVFQGTAGVVSLSATTVFAGQIQVNTTGYTLMNNSTGGTSGNRYFRTTNGIVLGSNVNLNLSSGVTTNGAATGFDAMITNAVGATGAQLTITGATLNADSSVRIMCDGSKADIWVPTTVATTGSGYASVKNVGSTNSIYGNVTVNSGSRLLFGASSSTRRINVKGNVTTANTDLMIGETGDVGMVVLYGSNTIGGNVLLKSGQLGYGTNNAFGTSTVVVSDGTTFGQQGTIGATDADRTINNTISLLGNVTLGLGSYSSFLGGTLDLNGATRTITLGNSAYLNGAVQNGGINVTSTSATRVLYLNGNNNYAGGTTLNGGTINLGNNAGLGTAGLTVNSNAVGNTLTATDGRNIASAISLSSGASLNLDSGSTNAPATTWTQAGAISGAGSVTKTGVGTLNLTGANSYTGSTAVSGGTLVAVTNNIRSTITSNSVAISFSNAPALGTYAVLPGALSGTYPSATFSGLSADQKASFSASVGTVTVETKTAQTITFAPLADRYMGDVPFNLGATASSGLAVTYTSSNPGVATVLGNLVTLVGVGTTQITASQSGDGVYLAAPSIVQSLTVRGGANIYGVTDLQNFESAPVGGLLRDVSGWSTTDQFADPNDPTRSDGVVALPGGGTAAFIGGWYTTAAKYPLSYRFDQGASDRIVFDWTQLITSSDPAIAGAVDRFGWEFKDSNGQTLFSLKMVQFVDTNGNGDWDPASGGVPAEPLANPADDQAGGNANFVPNKVLVVGYGANGERLPTSEMANYVQLDRNSWAQFRVIADLKTKKWYAQIKNGSSYINLTVPEGASLPLGVSSLNQVAAVWELNDTTQADGIYSMGGTNQMIFDNLSVQGAKVVILGLEVPALAAYDGAVRPANVTQDPAGVAVVSYSVLDSNGNYIALSGLPQDAGRYRVNVSVPSPYYAVDPANPTSGNSRTLSGDYRITSRSVTISGLTANDKAYNGTVYGTLNGTPVLEGVVSGDDVSIVGTPNVQFDSMEVGTAIPVRINGGYSLAGTKASNYQLTLPTFVANINKADPIVRSPAASVINYGQTLGESGLLGGASSVAGSWDWTTPSVILPAGTSSQTVTFTPTDLSHYNSVQASISVSVNKVTPTITTAPTASEIIYGQDLGASVLSSGVTSVPGSFAWTVPSTILAAGNRTQSVTFTPSDTANYNSVTTSVGVKINKAVPTIATAPTPSVITYNSTRTLANVALSGGAGSVPGLFSWQNPATVMVAGTSTQRAVFNPSENSNYEAVSFDVVVTVSKATPLISQSPTAGAIVYGQNLGSSVLTGGVGTVPGTFGWTDPSQILSAGNTPQEVTFMPEDSANYNAVTTSLYVRVNKATPTFTSLPSVGSLTFGQTLADATLTGGEASVAGSFGWSTPSTKPSAGSSSQSVTFTPSDLANYNLVTGLVTITVEKATPLITTIPTSSQINYGQTLDSATLGGGVASVGGRFAWKTPSAVLPAGTSSQVVTFTPSDVNNYYPAETSVSVTVRMVNPTITTVPTASEITYGQNLGASVLSSGVASVPGTFAWTGPSVVLSAGNRTQGVTFTPSDTVNYNSVTTSVGVKVNQATPNIALAPSAAAINEGQALSASVLTGGSATGVGGASVTGGFAFTSPSIVPAVGTANQSVTFTPSGSDATNYTTATVDVPVTVIRATTPAEDYLSSFGLTGTDAALSADPDQDGLTNAVEFAFGLNPKNGSGQPIRVEGDKIIYLQRNSDVSYAVKHTPDLGASWVGATTLPTPSVSQPLGIPTGYTQYELRMTTTGAGVRDFYKVDATLQ